MKNPLLALTVGLLAGSLFAASPAPIVPSDLVFAEVDGLVAVEAEHFLAQEKTEIRAWHLIHDDQFDADLAQPHANHAALASGGAYLQILPDTRITHGEPLIHGENFSNQPGRLAIVSYRVRFQNPGRYYVWIRHHSTGTEDNGVHVGLNGEWPESGQRWQTVQKRAWNWDCRQRTQAVHVGVPMQLYLDVPAAGDHTVQFSLREDGFTMDKFVLSTDIDYRPESLGPGPVTAAGQMPPVFPTPPPDPVGNLPFPAHWGAPPEIQTMDYLPWPGGFGHGSGTVASWITEKLAIDDSRRAAGVTLDATAFPLADSRFYLDRGKWAAVNPHHARSAHVALPLPTRNARYHVTLHTVGENDGRCTYEVLIGGRSLGTYTPPLAREAMEEGPAFNHTWENVELGEGESIEVRAAIHSSDGREYSRARWARVVLAPVAFDPGAATSLPPPVMPTSSAALAGPRQPDGDGTVLVHGELRQWHAVTLDLQGPFAHELDLQPNAFTDHAFDVTFTHESGAPSYTVPGYFAADGQAGESGAESGNVWRAHLSPDSPGTWHYTVGFARGRNAATYRGGNPLAPYDGLSGSFTIAPTDKTGRDFRARGRLVYDGQPYLRFAGDGTRFFKVGADAPETFLAYADFDNTITLKPSAPLKTWGPHVQDWREGDPVWRTGKGKGMIGAINYLAAKGVNAVSFLTYNAGGDGDNVWPYVHRDDRVRFDVSKLDQWGIVFAHAQHQGIYLHFKLQEQENDDHRIGARRTTGRVPVAMDAGETGPERRIYYRELIARFGHHLALNWNLGEENTQSAEEQSAMAHYLAQIDAYGHHRVIHTFPGHQERVYAALLGDQSLLTGASLQNRWDHAHERTLRWRLASMEAGRQWVVANDEQGPAGLGVPPDPGYLGFDGIARDGERTYDLHDIRKYTLWGNLMAGGAGVEYYFGYRLPQNDLLAEDYRSRDRSWDYGRIAIEFLANLDVDLNRLQPADTLVGTKPGANGNWCLAAPGELYVIYLPEGGAAAFDAGSAGAGDYDVTWFNPRTGETGPTVDSLTVRTAATLQAPGAPGEDWVAVLRRR